MVAEIKKLHPYYDTSRVLSYNCVYNFLVGARGLGKTYGFLKHFIKRALKTGEQFIYLRRFKDETKMARATIFGAVSKEFPDWEFKVGGDRGWEMLASRIADRDKGKEREWVKLGYVATLSTQQQMKGANFALVHTIIFDEFIIEKGLTRYLDNEAAAFNNFYSTVDRNSDRVKVYFLANSVSIMNPYFLEYEIRPDELPELSTKYDGFLLVHLPESEKFKESVSQTRFGRFIAGTEFGKYAVENKFADAHDGLIAKKPSDAQPKFNVETKHGKFSVWYRRRDQTYYMQEKLIGGAGKLYTLVPENMNEDRILLDFNNKMLGMLRTAFRHGMVVFDKPKTRNAMIDVFKR